MIFEFKGFIPVIHESSYVHPTAAVIGNVIIGKDVYIGPGASLRGDWGAIEIADGCNVQDNCCLHMFPGKKAILEENAHIGHGAIVLGAQIGQDSLIGMNSVIMDDVVIGEGSIVGALSFIKAEAQFEARSLIVGHPAKRVSEVSEAMLSWKMKGTQLYQTLPNDCMNHMREVEPLRAIPNNRPDQEDLYQTWESIKIAD